MNGILGNLLAVLGVWCLGMLSQTCTSFIPLPAESPPSVFGTGSQVHSGFQTLLECVRDI